ncbi:uncharacterized protein [Drosophila bipectinata]|uniref:uncharacterized protein n=1 Tax=Drosophila bipectinata TaxID=42026 RepID=UPI001C8AABCD|nr:uncharacterized protein LOC108125286 [Drosophila bipectinata]
MESRLRATHYKLFAFKPLYKLFAIWCILGFLVYFILRRSDYSNLEVIESIRLPTTRGLGLKEDNLPGEENPKTQKFFVKTSKCRIPYVDPFTAEVMEIYKPETLVTCTNDSDLVSTEYNPKIQRYVLRIDEEVAMELLNHTNVEYNCFYKEVEYGSEADTFDKLRANKYFLDGYVVPIHVEGIVVECRTADEPTKLLQKDAFTFVQYQPLPKNMKQKQGARKPSVIMYGIDSLSRINLRRTMPKVFKFLQGDGWHEMQGYNKVADNSFPNILAMLSGYLPETAKEQICDTDVKGCFDKMPIIWKYFKNASYLTGYAEDESNSNHFSYLKPGFQEKPVDYYFRPFLKALESKLDIYRIPENDYMRYCLGRRIANRYIYDYGRMFTERFVQERPIWGMFWSSHFSHEDPFMPSAMQDMILGDLLDLNATGALEETIMIFFADHGSRYGRLTGLKEGFLEERLPMMFIYLPPWFRITYPYFVRALKINQQRLCSNFDIHNTLKHIIELGGTPDGPVLPKSFDCPTCQSLFHILPENRTCAQAAIDNHYCTCEPYIPIPDTNWTKQISLSVIDRMNEYFVAKNLSKLCSNLTLLKVTKTEIKTGLEVKWKDKRVPEVEKGVYLVHFQVNQNYADFQATAVYNNVTQVSEVNVEKISRLNTYREDSTCIEDKLAKLYCICYSNLKQ